LNNVTKYEDSQDSQTDSSEQEVKCEDSQDSQTDSSEQEVKCEDSQDSQTDSMDSLYDDSGTLVPKYFC
jgi:hypothetical protein